MNKVKKTLFSIWAVVTLVLLLDAWWQTAHVGRLAAERDRIRYQSLSALLEQSSRTLDDAARYTGNGQPEQAADSVASSLALLDAAGKTAESGNAQAIRSKWEDVQRIRGEVFQPANPRDVQKRLRQDATDVRDLLRDLFAR
ncbi:MAG: hypothetical protein IT209_04210 [Armatimonadetes bacterium]|nr:hypothetical protein [Armatimonadota bacterium]